ncbi:MAG: hypothetical protein A3A30_01010 [Candidatus Terrybacteria bacterium RIFCSPLOWO2_01_FULL_48_14]|nr:MAG: hypothetical protein A3A30_01010 [Candidatus Terrybacteria bacterium RIFCSPLOWO2_01_FULL_48_14]
MGAHRGNQEKGAACWRFYRCPFFLWRWAGAIFFSSGHVLYRAAPGSLVLEEWENFRAFHDRYYADPIDLLAQSRVPYSIDRLRELLPEQQAVMDFFKKMVKSFLDSEAK